MNRYKMIIWIGMFLLGINGAAFGQQLGQVQLNRMFQQGEGLIRIAEPGQLADTVNVWGDISTPGRYLIPVGTTIPELISYANGPISSRGNTFLGWSKLKIDISISKYSKPLGRDQVTNYKYSYDKPLPKGIREFKLSNNEVLTVQVHRKPAFVDYLGVIAPVVSTVLTSIIIYQQVK